MAVHSNCCRLYFCYTAITLQQIPHVTCVLGLSRSLMWQFMSSSVIVCTSNSMSDIFRTLTAPFENQNTAFVGLLFQWEIFKTVQWISECNLLPSDVTHDSRGRVLPSANCHYFFNSWGLFKRNNLLPREGVPGPSQPLDHPAPPPPKFCCCTASSLTVRA